MVEYITREQLRSQGPTLITEQASRIRKAEERSPAGATFLSHSTTDGDLLPGVIAILERHGAAVYVDKRDPALPPVTSRETASILRRRIRDASKFILLASLASKDSRWMPWELGIADGIKAPGCTAVLPSPDKSHDRTWTEQEYLGVYDRIVYGDLQGHSQPVFMVWNQEKNTATELSAWLQG